MESGLAESLANRITSMNQHFIYRRWDAQVDVGAEIAAYQSELKGLIVSGSAKNVNSQKYTPPTVPSQLLQLGLPTLGICYGMQCLAKLCGQKIVRCWGDPKNRQMAMCGGNPQKHKKGKRDTGEQGVVDLTLTRVGRESRLFRGLGRNFKVWMKHTWMVDGAPEGWKVTASTAACPIAGLESGNVHLVQFHPEPYYSLAGKTIMHNFLTHVCEVETPYF
ncbi:MAG: gamma-glutamyl-gamma-aminobutyrate hydrolase family protein [Candidatus Odinarchaeota archaeon]